MTVCINCGEKTTNPKFCSRSCAAIHNNKVFPKRKPEGSCKKCGVAIYTTATYCPRCKIKVLGQFHGKDMTLEQAMYRRHHKSAAFALVRSRARTIMKGIIVCQNCRYDKHVEVIHVRPISDFPPEALLSEINDENNLAVLCRNCHWEFDHDLL